MNKLIVFLMIILYSCYPDHEHERHADDYMFRSVSSEKELNFIRQLEKRGAKNISYTVPLIEYNRKNYDKALVLSFDLNTKEGERDSLVNLSRTLSLELYENVLEDSIINNLQFIWINIESLDEGNRHDFYGVNEYRVSFLDSISNSLRDW